MIQELKKEVEKKFGKQIVNRRDCEQVSMAILELQDETISYNTLRRLFDISKSVKPNINTLNILSQFVGFKNFFDFKFNFKFRERNNLLETTYVYLYQENEEQLLNLVSSVKNSNQNFPEFITVLIRELLNEKKFSLINKIFNLPIMKFSNFNYNDIVSIGNSIGLLLRKKGEVNEILQYNINFVEFIYLICVDYSSLNLYYSEWTINLNKSKTTNEIKIFTSSILQFRNYLNNHFVEETNEDSIYSIELNPILCSRILSTLFISSPNINVTSLLNKYHSFYPKSNFSTDYYHELFTTSILLKNIEIMNFLMEKIDLNIQFYYQKNHLNSFYLMSAFNNRILGRIKESELIFQKFDLSITRSNYREFINLFVFIYLYDKADKIDKKNEIKKAYLELATKLNYPFFSENYLLNYFKEIS